jgi:hypothetical protein
VRNLQIVGAIEREKRLRAANTWKKAQQNGSISQPIFQMTNTRETTTAQSSIEFRQAA